MDQRGVLVMESLGELFAAMAAARLEFGAFTKSKTAKIKSDKGAYEYNYADLSDIIAATAPALAKHGLVIIQEPEVITENGKQSVVISGCIAHKSGGVYPLKPLPLPVVGGTAQAVGSAISYARRYQLSAVLNLAADNDDDAQTADNAQDAPQRAQGTPASKHTRAPATTPQRASTPATGKPAPVTDEQLEELNALGEVFYGDKWQTQQVKLTEAVTKGAVSEVEKLLAQDAQKLIEGIQKKMAPVNLENVNEVAH